MTNKSELLKCPCCGRQPTEGDFVLDYHGGHHFFFSCCDIYPESDKIVKDAANKWNQYIKSNYEEDE